jgi:immunity protein 26 of polymorphic toxin system
LTLDIQAAVGDIFQIPADHRRVGYGQVLASIKPNPLFLCVFEPIWDREQTPDVHAIVQSPILLLANSLDAKIWNGDWPIVGRSKPMLDRVPFPAFVTSVGRRDDYYLVSYDGKRRRKAEATEVQRFDKRITVAPARLEAAFKAHHGLMSWEAKFDALRFDHVWERSESAVSW